MFRSINQLWTEFMKKRHTLGCHQTCLAGKSSNWMEVLWKENHRKKLCIFQHAMFDYRRVIPAIMGDWEKHIWLVVVNLPLWKICVRQLGLFPTEWTNTIHVPNHQPEMIWFSKPRFQKQKKVIQSTCHPWWIHDFRGRHEYVDLSSCIFMSIYAHEHKPS